MCLQANECRTQVCANWRQKEERLCPLTAGSAVVADDWQQVIVGGLGGAVFGQERLQVQALEREGDVGAYLGGEHQLVPEALQVNTQDLEKKKFYFRNLVCEEKKEKEMTWRAVCLPLANFAFYRIWLRFVI